MHPLALTTLVLAATLCYTQQAKIESAQYDEKSGELIINARIPIPVQTKSSNEEKSPIVRFRSGDETFLAVVIGPVRPDRRWDILTTPRAIRRMDAPYEAETGDGKKFHFTIVSLSYSEGWAWGVTDEIDLDLHSARLATVAPRAGTQVRFALTDRISPDTMGSGIVTFSGDDIIKFAVFAAPSGPGIVAFDDASGEVISVISQAKDFVIMTFADGCNPELAAMNRPHPPMPRPSCLFPVFRYTE